MVEGDQDLIKDLNEQDLVEDLDGKIKDLVEHLVKDDQDLVKGDQKLVEGDQDLVKDLNDQDLVEDLDYDIKDLVKGDQDIGDEMEESGEVGENNQYYIVIILGNLGSMQWICKLIILAWTWQPESVKFLLKFHKD